MGTKIAVTDLWKVYPTRRNGSLSVLEGIAFSVTEGEFVAIIGPSGCGKSTLLNILAGFDRPDRGAVTLDGEPVSGPTPKGIFIFQNGSIFPWLTVQRNLMFGLNGLPKAEKRRLADRYAELVGLKGFEQVFPSQLSGGMRQRLEVARALMVEPEVLYMDEPFGSLDALTRLQMRIEFLRILSRQGHTVLLVTHDVEEALHLADRILLLSPRPARIQSVVEVPFPHPRRLSHPAVVELKERILRELGVEDAIWPGVTGRRPRHGRFANL
jgi:ABC-type nitrate/sulfonate/bicarbonate transport system ATPase subunit